MKFDEPKQLELFPELTEQTSSIEQFNADEKFARVVVVASIALLVSLTVFFFF